MKGFDFSGVVSETARGGGEYWPGFIGPQAERLQVLADADVWGEFRWLFNDNGDMPDGPSSLLDVGEDLGGKLRELGIPEVEMVKVYYEPDYPPSGRWCGWSSNNEALIIAENYKEKVGYIFDAVKAFVQAEVYRHDEKPSIDACIALAKRMWAENKLYSK